MTGCEFCGHEFPEELGRYGCPNCEGEALETEMNMFKVTFYHAPSGRRRTLIDNVTEEKADATVARFSDESNAKEYLPEVRKEPA